jgi:5-oxoprolinase (ATP-hydrolysing) subunit A
VIPVIDLNCDLGEGFGAYRIGDDAAVLPFITSANVACGLHAGDPTVMRRTVAAAAAKRVAVGAHPGLPDMLGFGRREMSVSPDEIYDLVIYQVGALLAFARAAGGRVRHVKPHGALYNMAARDILLAEPVASAVHDLDTRLALFGPPGSALQHAAEASGLYFVPEAFADRGYAPDGTLLPRGSAGAVLSDEGVVVRRALRLLLEGRLRTADGSDLEMAPRTLCIHGDGPHAAALARGLRAGVEAAGIRVAAPRAT